LLRPSRPASRCSQQLVLPPIAAVRDRISQMLASVSLGQVEAKTLDLKIVKR
jgi:hypothetical protein